MSATMQIGEGELESLIARALINAGTEEQNALSVARSLVLAEIDGQKGHGVSRVHSYAGQVESGKVDGHAIPSLEQRRPAAVLIDAKFGFAFPAIDVAIEQLAALAGDCGMACAGVTRSHHCGAMGQHVERLADHGLVAFMVSTTPKAMTPWQGTRPLYGTNPIAFAAPRDGAPALVIDLALSVAARGKIVGAQKRGESIPPGWAVDCDGNPTTDPNAALKGSLLPIGGAKGAALALMVEVMASALTGANFSFEASSFFEAEGSKPGVGHLIIAIDPGAMAASDIFSTRFTALAEEIEGDRMSRLPGTRRLELRAKAKAEGVRVEANLLAKVKELALGKRAP